jgi:dihydroorotate dehydrogenase (NAD+) catalytic subunit
MIAHRLDLSVDIAGVHFPNPLILASGIWGTSADLLARAARGGAGGVTAKSCGPEPRPGHPNPTLLDWGHGLVNAMGLPNPGAEEEVHVLRKAKAELEPLGVPLIASIFAHSIDDFAYVAETVSLARPDLIEVNISCPNVADEFGLPFAGSADSAAAATRAVKGATDVPTSVKLAPNVPHIGLIAQAVVEAGADAITAINTMPGMVVDLASGQPILANRAGGISGPALKPVALRCVYEIARQVQVPIIGTGGVVTGTDAAEMLMVGATAIGVGSALYYRREEAFSLIYRELTEFMSSIGYTSLSELCGRAHREPSYPLGPSIPPIP